uniref:Minor capsid protein P3-RTD n=1 Tax=Anthurium amnicola TaxID=1678845 RepID=A0A1D1XKP0_9ARAE
MIVRCNNGVKPASKAAAESKGFHLHTEEVKEEGKKEEARVAHLGVFIRLTSFWYSSKHTGHSISTPTTDLTAFSCRFSPQEGARPTVECGLPEKTTEIANCCLLAPRVQTSNLYAPCGLPPCLGALRSRRDQQGQETGRYKMLCRLPPAARIDHIATTI